MSHELKILLALYQSCSYIKYFDHLLTDLIRSDEQQLDSFSQTSFLWQEKKVFSCSRVVREAKTASECMERKRKYNNPVLILGTNSAWLHYHTCVSVREPTAFCNDCVHELTDGDLGKLVRDDQIDGGNWGREQNCWLPGCGVTRSALLFCSWGYFTTH